VDAQTWKDRSNKTGATLAPAGSTVPVPPDGENPTEMPQYSTRFHR